MQIQNTMMIGSTLKRCLWTMRIRAPLKIRKEVTEECYHKANSKVNLAVQLVKRVYSRRKGYIKLFRRSPF